MILRTTKTIMTPNHNPWADIPSAISGQLSRRRVAAEADFALFWFRDETGRPGLLIEISKTISHALLKEARINIRDILVDVIEVAEEEIRALVIRLGDAQKQDVFLKLCLDLIDHVRTRDHSENTFSLICRRLKKWQSLLSGKTRPLLSANEIQGLYAELYFLSEMLNKDATCEGTLIRGWKGPEKSQHDFILGNTAIEIKSISGSERRKVRISSEDQLDTHLGNLYLRVYFLAEFEESAGGESLNAIIGRISDQLVESENRELFELKLELTGYIDIPDYDTPHFQIRACRTYRVSEGFPRITRSSLPHGIEAVTYDLVLASIDEFRVDETEISGEN